MNETPQDNAAPTSAPPASGGGESGGSSTGATQIDMGRGRGGRGSKYMIKLQ